VAAVALARPNSWRWLLPCGHSPRTAAGTSPETAAARRAAAAHLQEPRELVLTVLTTYVQQHLIHQYEVRNSQTTLPKPPDAAAPGPSTTLSVATAERADAPVSPKSLLLRTSCCTAPSTSTDCSIDDGAATSPVLATRLLPDNLGSAAASRSTAAFGLRAVAGAAPATSAAAGSSPRKGAPRRRRGRPWRGRGTSLKRSYAEVRRCIESDRPARTTGGPSTALSAPPRADSSRSLRTRTGLPRRGQLRYARSGLGDRSAAGGIEALPVG
jgi:hypothetical protein